jgi:hypothetical protein
MRSRKNRRPVMSIVIAMAFSVTGSALAGCSSTAGPLQSFAVKGQPVVTDAGVAVLPGQSEDATTYVTNTAHDPVTLVSASLEPVAGFPTAKLTHVAINVTRNVVGVGTNWPPRIPIRPFGGASLPYGESRLTFAMSGKATDVDYATAGLKITYRYHGQDYTVTAWSAVIACVTSKKNVDNPSACGDAVINRVMTSVIKMAAS